MKKNILLVVSALLLSLSSCGDETSTDSNSNSDVLANSSNNYSESTQDSSFDIIDESKYEEHAFIDVEDLYLIENEDYYLNKMPIDGESLDNVVYESDNPAIVVDETGKITGKSLNGAVRVNGTIYVHNDTQLQKISVNLVDYNEFGSFYTSVDLGRLYHKNVIFFGDSITHNWVKYPGGDKPSTPEEFEYEKRDSLGYPNHYIPRLNNVCQFASITNAAWSGGTMAYLPKSATRFNYKSFPGAVEENVENIEKADYVFVFYGTNDLSEQVAPGSLSDSVEYGSKNNSTFIGGMNYGIDRIRDVNPDAIIIFMNLLTRTYGITGSLTYNIKEYNDAINEVAEAAMVGVLDVNCIFTKEELTPKYSNDGLHPNDDGYGVIANYILTRKVVK